MSPATGELMAELIDTGKAPLRARRMFERLAPGAASSAPATAARR
jgi:glycine/D-amino acid oxidase-like deaminating enzyme